MLSADQTKSDQTEQGENDGVRDSVNYYSSSWKIYKAHSEVFDGDISYYVNFCKGYKTLELFAGYGRLSNPLIAAGIDLETVELEHNFAQFIGLPTNKNHVANVLSFQSPYQYERIIAGYNSFCLFTEEQEIRQFFSQLNALLLPGGMASLNYYHQDYWKNSISYDFTYEDKIVHYTPKFDLSAAESRGQGVWVDEYSTDEGWKNSCKYVTKIYQSTAQFCSFFSHTDLELAHEVKEFGITPSEISEPGWVDYVLRKKQ